MKVKLIRKINEYYTEYEALENGTVITSCGSHPAFTKKDEDMRIFVKKNHRFQLLKAYIAKNSFQLIKEKEGSASSSAKVVKE